MRDKDIAVLSDTNDFVIFKTLNADVFVVDDIKQAEKTLKECVIKYSLILIAENLAKKIYSKIQKYETLVYPIILMIPKAEEETDFSMEQIIRKTKESLGFNVFKE